MLASIGILTKNEVDDICRVLDNIVESWRQNRFEITPQQEDCHTAIENHLVDQLGDVGKKIHTARSRNDQVLTALRLYYKDELAKCQDLMHAFIAALKTFVAAHGKVALPGYTHTRKAMPMSMAMWGGAFADAMQDNLSLLACVNKLIDQSPLGTAAGYGVPLKIDRSYTAKELGFKRVQKNALYAQHSRGKFEATILHTLSQIMFDLNRMASDLVFFSLPELGYVELPREFCTGSSIMPHKQNPDVLELIRAKYHTVVGYASQVCHTTANLISGYHRDVQLTKEPVMQSFDITLASLDIMALVLEGLQVDEQKCKAGLTDELFATEAVYELVKQGVPFREAYRMVASGVNSEGA